MIINWGKKVVHLSDEIVMVYDYFGVFWIFLLSYGVKYYHVDATDNVLGELEPSSVERYSSWSRIPFMHRFGLIIFAAFVAYSLFTAG